MARIFKGGTIAAMALLPLVGLASGVVIGLLIATKRFSLRTLLIATTFLAVLLGLVVYLARTSP
jgi:hypothetical protein